MIILIDLREYNKKFQLTGKKRPLTHCVKEIAFKHIRFTSKIFWGQGATFTQVTSNNYLRLRRFDSELQ